MSGRRVHYTLARLAGTTACGLRLDTLGSLHVSGADEAGQVTCGRCLWSKVMNELRYRGELPAQPIARASGGEGTR